MNYIDFCNVINKLPKIDSSFYEFIKELQTNDTNQIIVPELKKRVHLSQKEILISLILHPYPIKTILEILQKVSNPQWQDWNTIKINKDELITKMIQKNMVIMCNLIFDDLHKNAPYWLD